MTLADLTALFSRVGYDNTELMKSREVALFIQACIERQRLDDGIRVKELPPLAPVDLDTH